MDLLTEKNCKKKRQHILRKQKRKNMKGQSKKL